MEASNKSAPTRPVDGGGAVTVPELHVPFSMFASEIARAHFVKGAEAAPQSADIGVLREHYGRFNDALAGEMLAKYAVDVREEKLGGVSVHRVTPQALRGAAPKRGLLINFHGGGFMWGAGSGALVEAIPIAIAANTTVITVDYRLAPEHIFPAAVEDACAVYEAALADHAPDSIGLYGCSAGGVLTAQTIARLHKHKRPLPGAAIMLGGAGSDFGGDSGYVANPLVGAPPAPPLAFASLPYFKDADPDDPLAIPDRDSATLAAFPPSLLMSSTRDFAASSVCYFHRRLLDHGVDARLVMFDGLWHAWQIFCNLPESEETYRIMANFFTRTLRLGE
ncbi:MAG: alpha/beta hydrolase fold domain-containing protein [Terricaulis sp.]